MVLANAYPSSLERDQLMVMFSHHWDRIEGATFARHVLADPLVGSPNAVLLHMGAYDVQTPNAGTSS